MTRKTSLLVLLLLTSLCCACPRQRAEPPAVQVVGNATCPVSGKPVAGAPDAPTFHSDFEGYRIGFMCPVCKGTFDKAPLEEKRRLLSRARGKR